MRIAIIDDITLDRETLRKQVETQVVRLSLNADIMDYESGADFLSYSRMNRFDLVFMDIYMKNENGMDIARDLRQFDPDCMLVFITTSTDHALEAFRVRALHYLVKPYTEKELSFLFDEVIRQLPVLEPCIEINAAGEKTRIRFREVLYAEHYLHQIYIYTTDNRQIVIRQTFHEFCNSLADERFFQCNRGVIINLEHVEDLDKTDFVLKNGTKISISRSLIQNARQAFGNYLFKKGASLW